MAETVTLEQLEKTLFGTYRALKKRALAMIHNEAIVEATDLVKRFMGSESDPELLVFSRMVLQKLQDFSAVSGSVNPESLAPLLESPEPSRRILALRALLGRRSSAIPELLRRQCSGEQAPEAVALIAENLRHNPDPGNLPFLERFLANDSPRVRSEAYRGVLALISGSLLPMLLRGLADPAPELQVLVRQMARQFDRRHLIEERINYQVRCKHGGRDNHEALQLLKSRNPTV